MMAPPDITNYNAHGFASTNSDATKLNDMKALDVQPDNENSLLKEENITFPFNRSNDTDKQSNAKTRKITQEAVYFCDKVKVSDDKAPVNSNNHLVDKLKVEKSINATGVGKDGTNFGRSTIQGKNVLASIDEVKPVTDATRHNPNTLFIKEKAKHMRTQAPINDVQSELTSHMPEEDKLKTGPQNYQLRRLANISSSKLSTNKQRSQHSLANESETISKWSNDIDQSKPSFTFRNGPINASVLNFSSRRKDYHSNKSQLRRRNSFAIEELSREIFNDIHDHILHISDDSEEVKREKLEEKLQEIEKRVTSKEVNGVVDGISLLDSKTLNFKEYQSENIFLGKGGFGKAWKCVTKGFTFACKRINLVRFRRHEPLALFDNAQGCVPKLFAVIQKGDKVYLLMEYLPRTLEYLDKINMTEGEVKKYLFKTIKTIAALNKRGVIHRDIKPSNVAINEQDEIILLDLGTVWTVDDLSNGAKEGGTTTAYMSPQQCAGIDDLNCDMYAAACSILWILTGGTQCDSKWYLSKRPANNSSIHKKIASGKNHHYVLHELIAQAQNPAKNPGFCISPAFGDMLAAMVTHDSEERITPEQALKKKFFAEFQDSAVMDSETMRYDGNNHEKWRSYCNSLVRQKSNLEEELVNYRKHFQDKGVTDEIAIECVAFQGIYEE